MDKLEIRQSSNEIVSDDSRNVEGYALLFDVPSTGLDWVEVIHRGAVTEETIKNSDVFAKLNHNDESVLARSKYGSGSLALEVDDKGLRYLFEAPHTAKGDELLEYIRRGDIAQSSFAFTVDKTDPNSERWHKENGILYRDIYKIERLYDISPVFQPAYAATTCTSKRYAEVKERSEELAAKYDRMLEGLNDIFPELF